MLWFVVVLFTVILLLFAYIDTRKPKKFPPGPKWFPIIGSAPQVHLAKSRLGTIFKVSAEMSSNYGPVIGLKLGRERIVIVYGSQEIKDMSLSEDLLGRPIGPFYELRTWNKRRGILLTDNEFWHEQKRFLMRQLKEFGFGTRNMSAIIEDEAVHLLKVINNSINDKGSAIFNMDTLFNVSILNTIWKMTAGVRYSPDDKKMKTLQTIVNNMFKNIHMLGAPFSHFPILKYLLPEMSGYKCYVDTHKLIWDFLREELEHHKKTHDPYNPRDLMDIYLNVLSTPDHSNSFSEEQLLAICLDMFLAGSETTNNTLSFGLLHLVMNLQIQKNAQKEIDHVLGSRLPNLEDRRNMPYMEAIVLEALRMFGGRAFAVPHRALKTTYLGGYLIPKDSLVAATFYGCLMGPNCGFEEPERFKPERYLKDGKIFIPENYFPFGLGKRRCMGETLARANIFLFITALLQKYDLQVLPEDPPSIEILDGVTPGPSPFKARIAPRGF